MTNNLLIPLLEINPPKQWFKISQVMKKSELNKLTNNVKRDFNRQMKCIKEIECGKAGSQIINININEVNKQDPKKIAVFVLGPSASGKSHGLAKYLKQIFIENKLKPSGDFIKIDGGDFREKSYVWKQLVNQIQKVGIAGVSNLYSGFWKSYSNEHKKLLEEYAINNEKCVIYPDTISGLYPLSTIEKFKKAGYTIVLVSIWGDKSTTRVQGILREKEEGKMYNSLGHDTATSNMLKVYKWYMENYSQNDSQFIPKLYIINNSLSDNILFTLGVNRNNREYKEWGRYFNKITKSRFIDPGTFFNVITKQQNLKKANNKVRSTISNNNNKFSKAVQNAKKRVGKIHIFSYYQGVWVKKEHDLSKWMTGSSNQNQNQHRNQSINNIHKRIKKELTTRNTLSTFKNNSGFNVYFVRHCYSCANERKNSKGYISKIFNIKRHTMTPLCTERGLKESHALGVFMKNKEVQFDKVYSSPLPRAMISTYMIMKGMGVSNRYALVNPCLSERPEVIDITKRNISTANGILMKDYKEWEEKMNEKMEDMDIKFNLSSNNTKSNNRTKLMSDKNITISGDKFHNEIININKTMKSILIVSHKNRINMLLKYYGHEPMSIENSSIIQFAFDNNGRFKTARKIHSDNNEKAQHPFNVNNNLTCKR